MNTKISLLSLILVFCCKLLHAQSGIDCANAIPLPNINDYCSADAEYTTVGATVGTLTGATCFTGLNDDIWFSFIATADNVTITIRGNTNVSPGGTLNNPQVVLYTSANCTNFNQLACAPAASNIATLYKGGLTAGETYYIRVQGGGANPGSFKICYTCYFLPGEVSSDCPTGVHVCDKSTFILPSVTGVGVIGDEGSGSCLNVIPPSETNSIWITWVCETPGPLTFTLSPTDAGDDLDFAVYKLPNGLGDCTDKEVLRCCASGDFNTSGPPCMGPTGLSLTATDVTESSGCAIDPNKDNFVQFIDMVADEAYGLLINNFTSSGNGFKIEWGGTGTFKGATPEFTIQGPDTGCVGGTYLFSDESSSIAGPIISWQWNFGVGAVPATSNTEGPHNVTYNTPGIKLITLIVETSEGCKVSIVKTFVIVALTAEAEVLVPPTCNGGQDGSFEVSVTGGNAPYNFIWSGGPDQNNGLFQNVQQGTYAVSVVESFGCSNLISVEVNELELILNPTLTNIEPPSCTFSSDASIIAVVGNGVGPYTYNWGNGPETNNTLTGLSAGSYVLTVTDGNLCEGTFSFNISAPSEISAFIDTIDISCNGANDGGAIASASGGAGGYQYTWDDGTIGSQVENLPPGQVNVTVTDANGCTTTSGAFISEPGPLFVDTVRTLDVVCYGDSTGLVELFPTGGKKPFRYSLDGIRYQIDSLFEAVPAGNYLVHLRDANGCIDTIRVIIEQPEQMVVYAGPDQIINLGLTAQFDAEMLNPPFHPVSWEWTPSINLDEPQQPDPVSNAVNTTLYTLMVTDSTDCTATDELLLTIVKYRPVYIPNSFSPNGDGINDFFMAYGNYAIRSIEEFKIFDRWGNKVWEGFNLTPGVENKGWDGTFRGEPMSPSTFTYYLTIRFVDDELIIYKGDINLIK